MAKKGLSVSMRGRLHVAAVLFATMMLVSAIPASASEEPHWLSGTDLLTISQEQGLTENTTLSINGTSKQTLQNARWQLVNITQFDQSDVLVSGDYLSSVTPSGENRWSWTLVVDVEGVNCTCVVQIHTSLNKTHDPALLYVYLGESGHRPLLMDSFEHIHLLSQGVIEVQFDALTPLGTVNGSVISSQICEAPNDVCLIETTPFKLNTIVEENGFHIIFNATTLELPDGYWKFTLELEDLMLRPSNPVSILLHLDRQAPLVSLSNTASTEAIGQAQEQSSLATVVEDTEVLFTAEVSDGYAGESEVLTWSKVSPSGVQTAFDENAFVTESSVFFVPTESGEWTVSLLVRDSAGHLVRTTTTLLVVNEAPKVMLTLDGLTVFDGDQLSVPTGTSWSLNASQSTDTTHDQKLLMFKWYLGDDVIQNGGSVLDSSNLNTTGMQTLRLVVTDDNGAQSELSFTMLVPVESTNSAGAELGGNAFTLAFVGLVSLALFLLVRMGSSPQSESLPKWQSKKNE